MIFKAKIYSSGPQGNCVVSGLPKDNVGPYTFMTYRPYVIILIDILFEAAHFVEFWYFKYVL